MTNSIGIINILLKIFPTEQACIDYFEEHRWKGKLISPFDPASQVYKCANNRYRCKNTANILVFVPEPYSKILKYPYKNLS